MLHLLNPLLHTKWHSLQNLLRSRIRLETSHILRNFGSCSWCKPNENCHLLFFTQFIPVKVSESVRFLKQLIYNALSIPITAYHCPVSAMAEIFERSSFWSKSSRPALIRTTWLFWFTLLRNWEHRSSWLRKFHLEFWKSRDVLPQCTFAFLSAE